jgi:hypothetical protein
VTAPALSQISSSGDDNLNNSDLNTDGGLGDFNGLGDGLNSLGNGLGNLGSDLGNGLNYLDGGFGNLGSGVGNGLNSPALVDSQAERKALQMALNDDGKVRSLLNKALASGGTPSLSSMQTALADNRAVQHDLTTALGSGQIPSSGPLRGELQTVLGESRNLSSALRHALTSVGIPAEPVPVTGLGLHSGPGSAGLPGLGGLTAPVTGGGLPTLTGGASGPPVSSGRFAELTAASRRAQSRQGTH